MKKMLLVGNWKMNLNVHEASILVHRLSERVTSHRDIEIVLAPSYVCLQPISLQIDHRKFHLAAQNAYHKDEGAYTGEISFNMLRGLVDYVIIGHSDRRYKFGENLEDIRDKVAAGVRNRITPILCVGETKQERVDRETTQVLKDQVSSAISNLTADEVEDIVIAYEPVWAISQGTDYASHEVPTPDIISKAVTVIRSTIAHVHGKKVAENVRVLYGGSTSASTASGFLNSGGVNGLLVGGASLNYQEFCGIIESAYRVTHGAEAHGK